jgi:hypothetical protein
MDDDDNELSQSESCSAKILTEGERIEDIFYLTDKNDNPISDPKVSRRSLKMNQPLLFFWGVFFVIIKVSSVWMNVISCSCRQVHWPCHVQDRWITSNVVL